MYNEQARLRRGASCVAQSAGIKEKEGKSMEKSDPRYRSFVQILHEELIPAMGCTEPISLAYGAAKAREVLGREPERVLVEASGNIIKNVKSVVVPNTGGL